VLISRAPMVRPSFLWDRERTTRDKTVLVGWDNLLATSAVAGWGQG